MSQNNKRPKPTNSPDFTSESVWTSPNRDSSSSQGGGRRSRRSLNRLQHFVFNEWAPASSHPTMSRSEASQTDAVVEPASGPSQVAIYRPQVDGRLDYKRAANLKAEDMFKRVPRGSSPQRAALQLPFHKLDFPISGRRFMYFVGDLPDPAAIAFKAKELGISMLKAMRLWLLNCGLGMNVRAANQATLPKVYLDYYEADTEKGYVFENADHRNDYVDEDTDRNRADLYFLKESTRAELIAKRKARADAEEFVGPIFDEPLWRRHLPKTHIQQVFRTHYVNGELYPVIEYLVKRGDFRVVCNPTVPDDNLSYEMTYDNTLFDFIDAKIERCDVNHIKNR